MKFKFQRKKKSCLSESWCQIPCPALSGEVRGGGETAAVVAVLGGEGEGEDVVAPILECTTLLATAKRSYGYTEV